MNRNEEYLALMTELNVPPTALDDTVARAQARRKHSRKALRIFGIPAGSLAACFLGFMLLVNLFPPFAYACGQIPALKALAQAVAWSPSLSAAVENEYVQPIEETQENGDITAAVHYVIVDRKQVNIFYSLDYDAAQYESLNISYQFGDLEGWSGSSGTGLLEPGKLMRINLDFMDTDVPGAIDLSMTPYETEYTGPDEIAPPEADLFERLDNYQDHLLPGFTFHLEFDPYYTAQGEMIPVNQEFELDGQSFTLTNAELYPTHLRINLEDAPENTSWLEGLEIYLENERGEQFRKTLDGTVASGDPDGEGLATFWLDSPYFRNSKHLTLYVEQAKWKSKAGGKIRVDLRNNTCSELPAGIRFGGATQAGNGWIVEFIHPYFEEHTLYQGFEKSFWDENGTEYPINMVSSTYGWFDPESCQIIEEDSCFTESFPLEGYREDVVWLETDYDRITTFDPPVSITIR